MIQVGHVRQERAERDAAGPARGHVQVADRARRSGQERRILDPSAQAGQGLAPVADQDVADRAGVVEVAAAVVHGRFRGEGGAEDRVAPLDRLDVDVEVADVRGLEGAPDDAAGIDQVPAGGHDRDAGDGARRKPWPRGADGLGRVIAIGVGREERLHDTAGSLTRDGDLADVADGRERRADDAVRELGGAPRGGGDGAEVALRIEGLDIGRRVRRRERVDLARGGEDRVLDRGAPLPCPGGDPDEVAAALELAAEDRGIVEGLHGHLADVAGGRDLAVLDAVAVQRPHIDRDRVDSAVERADLARHHAVTVGAAMHGHGDRPDRPRVHLRVVEGVLAVGVGRERDAGDPAVARGLLIEVGGLEPASKDAVTTLGAAERLDLADAAVVGVVGAAEDARAVGHGDARDGGDAVHRHDRDVDESIEPAVAGDRTDRAVAMLGRDQRVVDAGGAGPPAVDVADAPRAPGDEVGVDDPGVDDLAILTVRNAGHARDPAPRLELHPLEAVADVGAAVDLADVACGDDAHVLEAEVADAAEGGDGAHVAGGHDRDVLHAAVDDRDGPDVASPNIAQLDPAHADVDGPEVAAGHDRRAEDARVERKRADVGAGLDRDGLHEAGPRGDRPDAARAGEQAGEHVPRCRDRADRTLGLDQPLDAAGDALDVPDAAAGRDREFVLREPRDLVEDENVAHVAGCADVALEATDGRVDITHVARKAHRGAEEAERRADVTDVVLRPQVSGELALARLDVADRAGIGLGQERGGEGVGTHIADVSEVGLQAEQGGAVDEDVGKVSVAVLRGRVAREADRTRVGAGDVERVDEPVGAEGLLDVAGDAQGVDLPGDL